MIGSTPRLVDQDDPRFLFQFGLANASFFGAGSGLFIHIMYEVTVPALLLGFIVYGAYTALEYIRIFHQRKAPVWLTVGGCHFTTAEKFWQMAEMNKLSIEAMKASFWKHSFSPFFLGAGIFFFFFIFFAGL